ncbi:VOC family protein [Legionella sp.]|uniref:VOC family protein n=1 Tax=Legionella sp. TaxID=459 RepID=UPI003CB07A4A
MNPSQFCWNELSTPDIHAAKEFYSKVFGWQFKEIKTEEIIYTIVSVNDQDIAGMWQIPNEMQGKIPPHWMAYLLVDDIHDSLKNARAHGAVEVKEVTEVKNMGRFAIITDPTGAHIAMWEVNKS